MKTNCKISKIIASVLVMATILCFGATGFAASYSTVTTYNLDAANSVDVTSTVTGLGQTEQVTYLATNGAGNILYVDQAAAEEVSTGVYGKVFTYSTTTDKIGAGTTAVKFGASTTTGITPNVSTDGMLSTVNVAVTAGNSTVEVNGTDVSTGFVAGLGQLVEDVTVTVDSGYQIDDISVNGTSIGNTVTTFDVATAGVASPSIVITTSEVDVTPALTGTTVEQTGLANPLVDREVTLFSQITLEPSKIDTAEYGIIVLMSAHKVPTLDELKAAGIMYKAYGYGTNNMYAVKLVGKGALTDGGKTVFDAGQNYVMAPYMIVDGETYYGDMQTFNCQ